MQIVLQSTGHAKSLAKQLCRSRGLKLTAAQNAVARMFGYADHRALCASTGKGAPAPYEDEMEPAAAEARRATFAVRLAEALGISPAQGRALVAELGPLRRGRGYADDWRARRQSYFTQWPLADHEDRIGPPPRGTSSSAPITMPADPNRFGPKARTVEIVFHRQTEAGYEGEDLAAKDAFGVEYVIATIRDGERVLGWLKGATADVSSAKTRRDLERAGDALDDWLRAGRLFGRRVAQEPTIAIAQPFGRVLVVSALIRDPRATVRGAGAALFAEVASAVTARHSGPFTVVLNATPPQYDFPPDFPPSFDISAADERALRSTGRAAAARSLRDHLLALPFPDFVREGGGLVAADVTAFDLDLPYHCVVPSPTGSSHPIDEAGALFLDLDFRERHGEPARRDGARALFRDRADPAVTALLIENAPPAGFDRLEAAAHGRAVRPHPALWTRMPKTVVRIEIGRTREEKPWARVRRALMDRATMREELLRAARGEPGPQTLRDGETDVVSFVFENGTVAAVPERFFASGAFADVVGPAFTGVYGSVLRRNPYTDEMSLGDLWSVLTSNVLLLYSGGAEIAFREDRAGWAPFAEARAHLAELGLEPSLGLGGTASFAPPRRIVLTRPAWPR